MGCAPEWGAGGRGRFSASGRSITLLRQPTPFWVSSSAGISAAGRGGRGGWRGAAGWTPRISPSSPVADRGVSALSRAVFLRFASSMAAPRTTFMPGKFLSESGCRPWFPARGGGPPGTPRPAGCGARCETHSEISRAGSRPAGGVRAGEFNGRPGTERGKGHGPRDVLFGVVFLFFLFLWEQRHFFFSAARVACCAFLERV